MARPRDRTEVKSAMLNIRVTPALKEKLEAQAKISGRKITAECEARLWWSMEETERPKSSPATQELLAEIEALIEAIEIGTESKWTDHVGTWAAVAEMLASGPIMARAPQEMGDRDKRLEALFAQWHDIATEQATTRKALGIAGINSLMALADPDEIAAAVESLELPPAMKQRTLAEVERLAELAGHERTVQADIEEIVGPFRDAIKEGRTLYPKPRRGALLSMALSQADQQPRGIAHLMTMPALPLPRQLSLPRGMFGNAAGAATGEGLLPRPDAAGE